MNIDEQLKVSFSFHDSYANESKGHYSGQIKLDRMHANPNEAADLISIELLDTNYPGGDFFFLHRSNYDGKLVMSWFFAGNGNCILDMISSEDFEYTPDEIIFEKESKETPQLSPHKDKEFHAVFWGRGADGQSLWIDDVYWTPSGQEDFAKDFPQRMILYVNDVPESILYSIASDRISDILGDDLFPGEVYVVQTDGQGKIINFASPEYKGFIDDDFDGDGDLEIEALIFDIIENDVEEIKGYINRGMIILFKEETIRLDDEDCYQFVLGTDHEDHFVQEISYAVNAFTRQVYRYDAIKDTWESVAIG